MSFTIYPAIDLRDGHVVRLLQGDYAKETRYPNDPLELAREYRSQGADYLHLVDLDGARSGQLSIHARVREIAERTGLKLQVGGGVRNAHDVQALLDAGASRVVVGSLAIREPQRMREWLKEFGPDVLTVALDTRRAEDGTWQLPVHGWTETSTQSLFIAAETFAEAGMKHLLCTDISRDGMMGGPSVALYAKLHAQFPEILLQASGGIRDTADIRAVRAAGCAGVVVGKALLEGRIDVSQATTC